MQDELPQTPREKLRELAQHRVYLPFIIGYLTSGLEDKEIDQVVQAALEFVEGMALQTGATGRNYRALLEERFQ